jgi:hypothetical protein
VDFAGNEPTDFGFGTEILPMEWFQSAKSQDERLFLAGRSLYFASDAGAAKLNNGLLAGAAINGVLTGLTLGISRNFVDTKLTVTHMMRESVLKQADEFGLKAAVRAGADPKAVLEFVERLAAEGKGATRFKELWFEDGRVDALSVVAVELAAGKSTNKQLGSL